MDFRTDQFKRTAQPPAKLNLFLEVLGRRGDGFHELQTLMVPVRLFDTLSLVPMNAFGDSDGGRIELSVRSLPACGSATASSEIPAGNQNLVVRALELLRERSGCDMGARVELTKRIPAAAGLGGGSSDAAAALRLANHAWQLNWSRAQLAELAAEIGSDVPFFLFGGPAVCRGRGERVEHLPTAPSLHFVIVKPPVELRTADVYRTYDAIVEPGNCPAAAGRLDALIAALAGGRLADIARVLCNSLEVAAAALSPWVQRARLAFDELDCLAHQLSGSGSAYFGLCRSPQHARRLASVLRARRLGWVYALRTCP